MFRFAAHVHTARIIFRSPLKKSQMRLIHIASGLNSFSETPGFPVLDSANPKILIRRHPHCQCEIRNQLIAPTSQRTGKHRVFRPAPLLFYQPDPFRPFPFSGKRRVSGQPEVIVRIHKQIPCLRGNVFAQGCGSRSGRAIEMNDILWQGYSLPSG